MRRQAKAKATTKTRRHEKELAPSCSWLRGFVVAFLRALSRVCDLWVRVYLGATPRPRTRAPARCTPTLTSAGFEPGGTRYSTIISLVRRSPNRSSAGWYDAGE